MPNEKRSLFLDIGKQLASFAVGVIVAAFILGRNSQKVNDVVTWKNEIAPRIERIDREGTISFELFNKNYEKREDAMTARVRDIEKEIKDIERRIDP